MWGDGADESWDGREIREAGAYRLEGAKGQRRKGAKGGGGREGGDAMEREERARKSKREQETRAIKDRERPDD